LAALLELNDVKSHRLLLGLAAAICFGASNLAWADSSWETDLKKAQETAKTQKKLLFIDFTGSDWCGYCVRLDRDILSRPQFQEFASKNLVLMEVDFPRRKEQSRETRTQNQRLAQQYNIQGFPTIVVLDGEGQTVWRYDGYFPDGPEAFIAALEKLRKG
jgi:thioredoxin-related protein